MEWGCDTTQRLFACQPPSVRFRKLARQLGEASSCVSKSIQLSRLLVDLWGRLDLTGTIIGPINPSHPLDHE